ncbi:hypothetical protein A2767_04230 [Candidatus Roizmanbacteria bacterium RIFCSPHIGHO2_01_FULL_35_10]|nr:MAG: hypothetical protein A2767_04230 [Candidatus Roizmanbacteria bacterium RIFCSPHIGHO2_01_FULL_35_10]
MNESKKTSERIVIEKLPHNKYFVYCPNHGLVLVDNLQSAENLNLWHLVLFPLCADVEYDNSKGAFEKFKTNSTLVTAQQFNQN